MCFYFLLLRVREEIRSGKFPAFSPEINCRKVIITNWSAIKVMLIFFRLVYVGLKLVMDGDY